MAETHHNEFKLVGPEKPQRAHASVGSEITVPCHLSPEISAVDMEIGWFKETDCVCLYKNREVIEGRGYEDRVSLSHNERGKVSLLLREFRKSDVGDYLCQVTSRDKSEEISVRVRGHKIDVAKGALGMCKIQIEKINRAWTKDERRKMKESGLMAVQLQGMDFGQVVEVLLYESDIRNKLQKQLEGRKQQQKKHVNPESSIPNSPVFVGVELRLVLLGRSGLEKRAAGIMILGREERSQTGTSTEIQQSESRQGEVAGRKVTVVETPDWFCSGLSPNELRRDVELCVCLSTPGPHVFLLVIPVKESAGQERGMLEKMEEILVERCWKHTVILFTVTDEEQEKNIEKFIQSGHQEVQRLVEKCENRFHCLNINQSGDDSQVLQLLEKIEKMVAGNTDRFQWSDIYLHESQIQELERKLRMETEQKDTLGRQMEEKNRDIQTLNQKILELKAIQEKQWLCVIS
ncbi:GTPase IMAP family member 2 [Labeo rohita]|uniref:GTPase IMAP family member 2 n=1 Tax=Labeo rohita TaxID=84645 RepID=A0ABQ8MPT1_LABRO|nr:GTPase IMAP family member 2 [Labeo rohita]